MTGARGVVPVLLLPSLIGLASAGCAAVEARVKAGSVGRVEVDGAAAAGVEVVLLDGAGRALAAATTDARGGFALEAEEGATAAWILARLRAPVVGVAAARVGAAGTPVVVSVASRSAVTLSVAITPPAGVAFDWAEVHVTSRAAPGLPSEVVAAATLVGRGPSRRGTYHSVRVSEPSARFRVLPGAWDVKVEHIVERSPSPIEAPPNWAGDVAHLPDGKTVAQRLGSHRLEVTADLPVTIAGRRVVD